MTSELIRVEYEQTALATMGALVRKVSDEATRLGKGAVTARRSAYQMLRQSSSQDAFEDNIHDMNAEELLGLLERHALERDGWQRSMSATVALLRYAHLMIERAEGALTAQKDRIDQLESMSVTDELTGIANRRGFLAQFMQELDRCDRDFSQGGLLVLIDLDNFKAINDRHGHLAGDAALRLVARALADEVRTMDVAARLGGDEFVLLLSNTTKKKAAERAQQLAWRLNHLSLAWYGDIIPISASLGLKAYKKGDQADAIFNGADVQMYARKAQRKARRAGTESL